MKIGMMAAWNQTSGVSIHSELVGREWVKQGHNLKIYSFIENDFHGRSLIGQDENYVIRCFGTRQLTNFLDPVPFLESDHDIFVAQDINMVPMDKLQKIFHLIKRKSKTVHVVHENRSSKDPSFYQHDWDALVCFDDRFKDFLSRIYSMDIIRTIPFPHAKWDPGNKIDARKELDLPLEEKIVFIFGQKWQHLQEAELQALRELSKDYDLLVLIISETQRISDLNLSGCKCLFKKEVLERDKLYKYLHASDTWLFPKRPMDNFAVLSSTIHFAMGSGCVAVARDSNFLYEVRDSVLHYNDKEEFKNCLIEAFEQGDSWEKARGEAKNWTEKHGSEKIAGMFIDLFESLS
jgi:hypothetical protein